MPISSTFAKKTKQEILADYEQLLKQFEDLKLDAKQIYRPENLEITAAAKNQTADTVSQSVAEIKKTIGSNLEELAAKLNGSLAALLNGFLSQAKKFSELEQALELSRKNLAVHYNIQVAAETLEQLVSDYEMKKQQLEKEALARQEHLDAEINSKKREQDRSAEEYDYDTKLNRKRETALFEETMAAKEKALAEREANLKQREQETAQLKKQVEQLPEDIAKEVAVREKDISKHWENDSAVKTDGLKKDWEAERKMSDLKLQNLAETIKRQDSEIISLKKETELANKKAQELAVRIIESGAKAKGGEETAAGQKSN